MSSTARAYLDLGRPFTLVAPALGFISGALTAVGAAPREHWTSALLVAPILGSVMAATLNAGNNALNQIYDLEIDTSQLTPAQCADAIAASLTAPPQPSAFERLAR